MIKHGGVSDETAPVLDPEDLKGACAPGEDQTVKEFLTYEIEPEHLAAAIKGFPCLWGQFEHRFRRRELAPRRPLRKLSKWRLSLKQFFRFRTFFIPLPLFWPFDAGEPLSVGGSNRLAFSMRVGSDGDETGLCWRKLCALVIDRRPVSRPRTLASLGL